MWSEKKFSSRETSLFLFFCLFLANDSPAFKFSRSLCLAGEIFGEPFYGHMRSEKESKAKKASKTNIMSTENLMESFLIHFIRMFIM